ncbi:MAG: hypothetical protein ABI595_15405 [Actinomycetota bacterium]
MEFLMAAGHGPGEHGAIVNVILLIAVIAALILVVRTWLRRRSEHSSERHDGRGA